MNKEELTKELVCLLDEESQPDDVAEFKQLVESFFIAGAARIDLIAEIMNLDNDIGGYNFDIPLLAQTEEAIGSLRYGDYGLRTTAGRALSFVCSTGLSRANIER